MNIATHIEQVGGIGVTKGVGGKLARYKSSGCHRTIHDSLYTALMQWFVMFMPTLKKIHFRTICTVIIFRMLKRILWKLHIAVFVAFPLTD